MKCYICALAGKRTDAIATCIVCGIGLCENHLKREEIPMWTGETQTPETTLPETMPRILCYYCYEQLRPSFGGC